MPDWSCKMCTLLNKSSVGVCDACGSARNQMSEDEAFARALAVSDTLGGDQRQRSESEQSSQTNDSNKSPTGQNAEDFDPWAQAEAEWAQVEACQEMKTKRK